jgi:hypothetical protein
MKVQSCECIPMTMRRAECLVLVAIIAVLCLWEGGGQGFFSPDTLEIKTQSLSVLGTPIRSTVYRDELIGYLVSKGYWTEGEGRGGWQRLFRWQIGMGDSTGPLQRFLFWHAEKWIAWSEEHPHQAAILWPHVLEILRSDRDRGQSIVAGLLLNVQKARTDIEIDAVLRKH